jgi:hypothetical protein
MVRFWGGVEGAELYPDLMMIGLATVQSGADIGIFIFL